MQLPGYDIVQPDLVIVLKDNRLVTPTKAKGSPEHAIDILSPSTERNDRQLKHGLYQRVGIGEYWIVDPQEQIIEECILTDGQYTLREHGPPVGASYLPGVSVDLQMDW